ncbi:MAG TPA: MFS transporter [Tepidisphaeraceae bacterium]|nr:MFS transporter [Tepidisphaeraceae bacterium]
MTHGRDAERKRLALVHTIEALISAAANLLTIGVFFFMQDRFGWGLGRNFTLSAFLGVFYIAGALAAHPLTKRFGQRKPLAAAYLIMGTITLVAGIIPSPVTCTVAVLIFALASSTTWPIVEHLVSAGENDPHLLSRRLALYNIVWAAVGALIIAINGYIIEKWPNGEFLIPAICSVASAFMVLLRQIEPPDEIAHAPVAHQPEPTLARQRVLALWLSRISVPAMYLMIYSLAAMLPSLPVIHPLRPAMQTLISSVWLVVRWASFIVLGATAFWHTRPRLLLTAAAMLLVSLFIITIRPGELFGIASSEKMDLAFMILGQVVFGVTTGLIYAASLYFGMVLSQGSTEHGGYHEALIGLGMMLGPTAGAITQWKYPGSQRAAVLSIAALIGLSILLASMASLKLRRRHNKV